MVQGLIVVLNQLAGMVAGTMDIRPDEPATAYLPDEADLATTLATPAARTALLTTYLAEVRAHWTRAEAAGLIVKLDRVRTEAAAMKTRSDAQKKLAGLPNGDVTFFHEYLALDNQNESAGRATIVGRDLVLGAETIANVTGTVANARRALLHLRRLDDVLTRILAASAAALATGTPIADVLAMYRTEGNMDAPPSTASLVSNIPSGTFDAISIVSPAADLRHLVWLAHPAASATDFPDFSTATDETLLECALVIWFVQIGGLDEVILLPHLSLPRPWQQSFADWSARNWRDGGATIAIDRATALARWNALIGTLHLERSDSGTSVALKVTPDNPELLISGVLQEAVMRQRARGKVENLLSPPASGTPLSPNMAYLHFHAGTEQMQAILVRALVAAMTTSGLRYMQLRSAILNDIRLGSTLATLAPITSEPDAIARPALVNAWPYVEPWLRITNHLDLLGDFVETVDGNTWSSWGAHRGNLSRYRMLRDYYAQVMK